MHDVEDDEVVVSNSVHDAQKGDFCFSSHARKRAPTHMHSEINPSSKSDIMMLHPALVYLLLHRR